MKRALPVTVLVVGLGLALFAAVRYTACSPEGADAGRLARQEPEKTEAPLGDGDPAADESRFTPIQRQQVTVYFPAAADNGLVGEEREIFLTSTPGDRAKQIVADLISGPTTEDALRALPHGTRLRQIYVMNTGVAYVDFSIDLKQGLGGGSMKELLTVYSIVDSVALNIEEIRRVGILINGQPIETLSGHVDLRRPLSPNLSLIVGVSGSSRRKDEGNALGWATASSQRPSR